MHVASRAGHRQVMPVEIISDKIGCQCGAVENCLHKRLSLSFIAYTPTDRTRVEESFLRVRASPKRPVTLIIGCHPRIIAAIRIFRIQNVDIRMLNGIAREYAIGRRRRPNGISLNRMPRRIHIERAVLFCSIAPNLVVYVLRSTLAVNSQSHNRSVGRSSNELVGVLTRPIVAIVRNGWERIFTAPLVVVAHRIGRFIIANRTYTRNSGTDITVHKCFPT